MARLDGRLKCRNCENDTFCFELKQEVDPVEVTEEITVSLVIVCASCEAPWMPRG